MVSPALPARARGCRFGPAVRPGQGIGIRAAYMTHPLRSAATPERTHLQTVPCAGDHIRVGVDLTPMLPGSANGGAKFAVLQFLDALLAQHTAELELTFFVPEIAERELRRRYEGRVRLHRTLPGTVHRSAWLGTVRELRNQAAIRHLAEAEELDVLYSPFGRYLLAASRLPLVALITDLLHRDYPESLGWRDRFWRHLNLKKLAMSNATFQVPSEFTRERLHSAYRVAYGRIFRTYQPIQARFGPPTTRVREPFFLYPARPWRHKNHENLLRAFRLYRDRVGAGAWRLALTNGGWDRAVDAGLAALTAELGLQLDVDLLGEVPEENLLSLYERASALVFPSRYEGFGIPLLEAMHFSLPIICGRGGSQMEVSGDAALFVDVEDTDDLADAMVRITTDEKLRARLVEAGRQQLRRFSLDAEVKRLAQALGKLVVDRPKPPLQRFWQGVCFTAFDLAYIGSVVVSPLVAGR